MIRILAGTLVCAFTGFAFFYFRDTPLNVLVKKTVPHAVDSSGAEINYRNYCGGCHGEKMNAFVDRSWKHGNTKEALYKAIKDGYADEGMPAFTETFSDKAINELAEYILTGIADRKKYDFEPAAKKENFFSSSLIDVKLDTVFRGINVPWAMAFLPGGEMLVTERSGKLYRVDKAGNGVVVAGTPTVVAEGQGGLLDVILHPAYAKNNWIYLSYSKRDSTGSLATTAIMRARLDGNKLVDQKDIFVALPYSKTRHHYGSRMVFDKNGFLYFSVGERGNEKENPQSLANDLGKIHRIKDDGGIPADNPFVNDKSAAPSNYTYGNRNPQGLTMNPFTGDIWENEHGPRGGDEINIVGKGKNYGWPVISYGINYNGQIITNKTSEPGMEQPILYWIPSIGPSGMAFVNGTRYKGWEGNVMSGSLRFNYLNRCVIKDNKVAEEELILKNIGRMRDVRMAPDGYIYVAVESPGYIFRLVPVDRKK